MSRRFFATWSKGPWPTFCASSFRTNGCGRCAPPGGVGWVRRGGWRYGGRSYGLGVPDPAFRPAPDVAGLIQRSPDAHSRRYGHMAQNEAVEMVNFQVTAVAAIPRPSWRKVATG